MAVGAATVGSLGIASAASNGTGNTLVDKIASKFNLNKSDVQKVFDEDRASHEAEHQQVVKDKLAQLVKDGKLTQDQADKLTAKAKELKAERDANNESFRDKTEAERKTAMDQRKQDIDKWLSDNNIDQQYARFLFGGMGHHGFDGHGSGMMRSHSDDMGPSSVDN